MSSNHLSKRFHKIGKALKISKADQLMELINTEFNELLKHG